MRWKTVALAGAFGPAMAGCSIVKYTAMNAVNEPHVVCTQIAITHELRSEACAVWKDVRCQYPRKAFTAEFHEGFLDGYVDFLDKGGNGSLPAVPPSRYTRNKKYYTEEGHCLLQDYLLGFKYGQDVAIASGRRKYMTVPVLLPQQPSGPPSFTIQPDATATPPIPGMIPPTPPNQTPVLPVPKPAPDPNPNPKPNSDATPMSKFGPRPDPNALPAQNPPLPISVHVGAPPVLEIPDVKLPPPPPEVPTLPEHVPTPSTLDELPVIPPNHMELPVVPPSRIEP